MRGKCCSLFLNRSSHYIAIKVVLVLWVVFAWLVVTDADTVSLFNRSDCQAEVVPWFHCFHSMILIYTVDQCYCFVCVCVRMCTCLLFSFFPFLECQLIPTGFKLILLLKEVNPTKALLFCSFHDNQPLYGN